MAFILLLLFFPAVAGIDFFHTEEALQVSENCPACHFHNSLPNLINYDVCATLQPPRLLAEESLSTSEAIQYPQIYLDHPSSRAPPQG